MKKLFLLAIVVLGFTAVSFGQAITSPNASSTATIVGPRSVSKTGDLNFGTIVNGITGAVVIGTADNLVSSVPTHIGGTISSAKFRAYADEGTTFSISFPNTSVTLTESVSGETMVASSFVSSPSGTGSVAIGSTYTQINVGGTLTVASATQATGTYLNNDASTGLKVTVNFN